MKKILIILLIPIMLGLMGNTKEDVLRIRVIANSNSEYDQTMKMNVSNNLREKLYDLLKNEKDVNNARKIIKENIGVLDNIIDDTLKDEYDYTINYGMNYFPEKTYNGKTYKEGNYESLLVTLGKGNGDNWWCILFPPICLIEVEDQEEVEYSFFLKDIFDRIFN